MLANFERLDHDGIKIVLGKSSMSEDQESSATMALIERGLPPRLTGGLERSDPAPRHHGTRVFRIGWSRDKDPDEEPVARHSCYWLLLNNSSSSRHAVHDLPNSHCLASPLCAAT